MDLHLWTTDGNLNSDVLAEFIAMPDLGSDTLVVDQQDFFVRHLLYLRTDSQVSRCNRGIAELNYGILTFP
jgi:hypothetical protein